MHGGTLNVASRLHEGTTFTVTHSDRRGTPGRRTRARVRTPERAGATSARLYVTEALRWVPDSGPAPRSEASVEPVDPSAGTRRIILADDNADMREYVHRLLSDRWSVDAYPDGRAALEAARRHAPGAGHRRRDDARARRLRAAEGAAGEIRTTARSRSSCCRRAPARRRASKACRRAPAITSSSRSPRASCARASTRRSCAPRSAPAQEAHARRLPTSSGRRRSPSRSCADPTTRTSSPTTRTSELVGTPPDARQAAPRSAARTGGPGHQGAARRACGARGSRSSAVP